MTLAASADLMPVEDRRPTWFATHPVEPAWRIRFSLAFQIVGRRSNSKES
jgi:hypothetical protein